MTQGAVHHKSGPGHVARILQNAQKEEEDGNHGQERENAAYAGDDAVAHQGHGPGCCADASQGAAHGRLHAIFDDGGQQIAQPAADGAEGEPEHNGQHGQKHWESPEFMGDHGVDAVGPGFFPFLANFFH